MRSRIVTITCLLMVVGSAPHVVLAAGPDIRVFDVRGSARYGPVGGVMAFSFETVSCNIGDQPANWVELTPQHPVIAQNMYRLKNGRFEHIGLSWVKHGFSTVVGPDANECGGCQNPGCQPGFQCPLLGVGCSDPYSASLNADQSVLGPRSQVNAHTGVFPYPYTAPACPTDDLICRRLQVHVDDLRPDLNAGALYFLEAHYVTADDAAAGNGNNNASHRALSIVGPDAQGKYSGIFSTAAPTQQGQAGIRAWRGPEEDPLDPSVVETDIEVAGDGLFILAAKATDLGTGYWQYEYALQNLNCHRSGGSFSIPLPTGAELGENSVGFHDVDYHSGEPYDGTDWPASRIDDVLSWSTQAYAVNPNANALRWGTLYNFRFSTNKGPGPTTITLGLFRPPSNSVTAASIGPMLSLIDCNHNLIADACDICMAPGCVPPCFSRDCNGNHVPDECESDCNRNGVPDTCDVNPADPDSNGMVSRDCQGNLVPDECEPDCDGDGIPDDCDVFDTDGDGIPDCFDKCPTIKPLGSSCICPPLGDCCYPPQQGGFCLSDIGQCCIPPDDCIAGHGIPECRVRQVCRDGCLIGDADNDGRLSLKDYGALQGCFTGESSSPGYQPPSVECARLFDFDQDGNMDDVDLADYGFFYEIYTSP